MHSVDTNIERVRKSKEEKSQEVLLVVERMQSKLEDQLVRKVGVLHGQKRLISQEVEHLESLHDEIKQQLCTSAKSSLIAKTPDLLRKLKDTQDKPVTSFAVVVDTDFPSEIVPEYDASVFTLQGYSRLKESSEVVYSEALRSCGLTWRLKVYPNGNGLVRGTYLSVFLEMLKGLQDSSKYQYRVELVNNRNPRLCVVREFASDFKSGECWGYNRFYRIDLLEEEGYLDPDTDQLVLKFFVRAIDYAQQCRDQKAYIAYLEQSTAQALDQVAELKLNIRTRSLMSSNEHSLAQMEEDAKDRKYSQDCAGLQWDDDSNSEELRLIGVNEESKLLEDNPETNADLATMLKELLRCSEDTPVPRLSPPTGAMHLLKLPGRLLSLSQPECQEGAVEPGEVSYVDSEGSEDLPELYSALSQELLQEFENTSRNWQTSTAEREILGKELMSVIDAQVIADSTCLD
jgi:tripartite motif-containing protein 37